MNRSGRANLLFVFADQMRGQDMALAGNPQIITPNMDRLGHEGTVFTRACANCPVSTPSRATMLTGRYPLSNRAIANDLPLPEDAATLGEAFREAGYRTGYIGKWHLDGVPRDRFTPPGARRHGFEFWAAWNCSHDYFNGRIYRDAPEPVRLEGYEPAAQTEVAMQFLRQGDERPFCLFLSWGPPHAPYEQVPEKYGALYRPEEVRLRPNVTGRPPPGLRRLGEGPDPRAIAGYCAHITALDVELGRLLLVLEELGLSEDTIVVFTSDHGDMLWSQGMQKKQQPWEESVSIPLLIRWPGRVPPGRRCDALLGTVDFAPTLVSLAGIEAPGFAERTEGADLSALVLGGGAPARESVFLMDLVPLDQSSPQGLREWRGVRTKRYTYARWADGDGWLLYDNESDPYQMKNLVDSPEHSSVRRRLEKELRRWLKLTGDESLPWEDLIRSLGLVELWNAREREMHPRAPRLLA